MTAQAGGIGFLQVLCLVFIVLKLCGQISWPWLWVLAPIWVPLGVAIVCGALWLVLDACGVK